MSVAEGNDFIAGALFVTADAWRGRLQRLRQRFAATASPARLGTMGFFMGRCPPIDIIG
jgi:hypothetical protein